MNLLESAKHWLHEDRKSDLFSLGEIFEILCGAYVNANKIFVVYRRDRIVVFRNKYLRGSELLGYRVSTDFHTDKKQTDDNSNSTHHFG